MMDINVESIAQRVPALVYVYYVNHDTGDSGFHFVSDHVKEMFGYTPQQVYDEPKLLVNAIVEEEAEAYAAAVMESMEKLAPFDRLGRMRHANGKVFHVHYKSQPRLVEEKNEETGAVSKLTVWDGIAMNVSTQIVNEDSNRTKVEEVLHNSMQPIFEIDTRGNISEWNNAMTTVTGYGREDVLGQPVVGYMVDEERGNFCSFVAHSVKDDDEESTAPKTWDCVFVTKKQRRHVYLHAKCTKSRDANLSEMGLLCCCQDVTKVKEAEKQKDDALKLVDAERGLTEWLSHEVRNPLSVAMEAAVALQDGDDITAEENTSYSELICESIRYIVDLLTNMLDLNKCLDGKIALYPTSCMIREEVLIPTCKIMFVRNDRVKLILEEGDEVEAMVDKLRLRQVITNLVANSLKFTKDGFVRVALKEVVGEKNNTMRITVADSGCGINPSDYDILFSKWERLGSQINGAGIGLCLSRTLVRSMGGELSLDKDYKSGFRDNRGCQFTVELPLSTMLSADGSESKIPAFESLSAAVLASNRISKRTLTSTDDKESSCDCSDESCTCSEERAKKRVCPAHSKSNGNAKDAKAEMYVRGKFNLLIVDDDKMGRRLLTRRFQRLFPDANVVEVASGEEALKEAEQTTFDIITVDHFMAVDEMNGAETIKALRERHKDCCIVGISGNSKREEHLEAGAQDFFQKPIPKDDVLMERLITKISPPSGWKVLCVDDVDMNVRLLSRRLCKVAAPYFTSLKEASKRWKMSTRSTGEDAIELLKKEWFDLVVVDQHLGEGITGTTVASLIRTHAVNPDAVVVLNTGSMIRKVGGSVPYNVLWPKPLPSTEKMRLDLCRELLAKSGQWKEEKKNSNQTDQWKEEKKVNGC